MNRYAVYKILLPIIVIAMAGCGPVKKEPPKPTTIRKTVSIEWNKVFADDFDIVLERYYDALENAKDKSIRQEAILRLAVLEMQKLENIELRSAESVDLDYTAAIELYEKYLKEFPRDEQNEHVFYQLAKAYDLNGELDKSIMAINRLLAKYPNSSYKQEILFRRGELQFILNDYKAAIQSYKTVIAVGKQSHLYEKALYKYGWALYKEGRVEDALDSFFSLLSRKLDKTQAKNIEDITVYLSRGDRELLDDTLRILSLVFSSVDDSKTIAQYFEQKGHRSYEYLIYQHLGKFYLDKERYKDAADMYNLFAETHPNDIHTPNFELLAIEAYKNGKFTKPLLRAKEDFVKKYHAHENLKLRKSVSEQVKATLEELAEYHHAKAQQEKTRTNIAQAIYWYRTFLKTFQYDPRSARINFLLAEILFETGDYVNAAKEYEKTAYRYGTHPNEAEAGYAALLAYDNIIKENPAKEAIWQDKAIESALRFADAFPSNPHVPDVLGKSASDLFADGKVEQAARIARKIINLSPKDSTIVRTAWMIIAHRAFERKSYARAEALYGQILNLTSASDPLRSDIEDRLAASIYKQGEIARNASDMEEAARHFLRAGQSVTSKKIGSTAEYDAATIYITIKDWKKAITILEDFRKLYPDHPLQNDVTTKLAYAYIESNQKDKAAREFRRIAKSGKNSGIRREASWQSAELFETTNNIPAAIDAYKQYIASYPFPLEEAIEARNKIAQMYKQNEDTSKYHYWLKEIVKANDKNKAKQTARTRFLAGSAALVLADLTYEEFRKIKLVEPLKKSLKLKKKVMQRALDKYNSVLEQGIAGITTASNYHIATIYYDFSKALMNSERPGGLSADELEEYDILLEEQAFPFEEKSIEAHETNIDRVKQGIFDDWINKSFVDLASLYPARYARNEKSEIAINVLQ
ncbi:MAG: tetratricopeptide repeat protein [Gammaproteobacteria bacterium]